MTASFIEALTAEQRGPDRADKLDLYARFLGAWSGEFTAHAETGQTFSGAGEIHFGLVLAGRAVQDVWIFPSRATRPAGVAPEDLPVSFWGSTFRIYDPAAGEWRIFWIDPERQNFAQMTGRAEGADIVQLGTNAAGAPIRWRFTEITPSAFRWLGEVSDDNGASWRLQMDIRAERV